MVATWKPGVKRVAALAVLLLAAFSASAKSTICKLDDGAFATAIAFSDDKSATFTAVGGATYKGTVTAQRPHNKEGLKTNLFFVLEPALYAEDAMEFMLFSTGREYRVIGVGYRKIEGKFVLDIFAGNNTATCATL